MTKEEYEDKVGYYRVVNGEARRLRMEIIRHAVSDMWNRKKWKLVKFSVAVIVVGFLMQVFVLGKIETRIIELPGTKEVVYVKDTSNNMQAFLDAIKWNESGNKQKIVNSYGYMGFYQVGRTALSDIGMGGLSNEDFLESAELQEIVMRMLLKKNKEYLKTYIGKYQGKTIGGVLITESGLLGAAHGTGAGSVMKFLISNGVEDPVEGNGIKTSYLIKKYGGYNLKF